MSKKDEKKPPPRDEDEAEHYWSFYGYGPHNQGVE